MKTAYKNIQIQSKKEFDFIDLTDEVKSFISQTQIKNGLINIQCFNTSSAIFVNENEPLLFEDIKNNLEKIAPKTLKYNHDDLKRRIVNVCSDECLNGHSHCKAIYLPTTITLNLIEGSIQLGQWQRIFFVELDKARERKVQVMAMGE